jgi:polar amino acid transport system substrate-binding protein
VSYESAGKVADDAQKNVWDVAFLAIDPKRADTMAFTDGYVEIGGAYLVWRDSPMRENEDLDRKGVRIATSANSGYDLFLTRELKNAELVRVPDPPQAVQLFLTQKLDAVAAVRELLTRTASENPSVRVLDKNFMVIRQAVVVPKGREAASAYMAQFVEELKASGFVADSVKRSGSTDATVAPPVKRTSPSEHKTGTRLGSNG